MQDEKHGSQEGIMEDLNPRFNDVRGRLSKGLGGLYLPHHPEHTRQRNTTNDLDDHVAAADIDHGSSGTSHSGGAFSKQKWKAVAFEHEEWLEDIQEHEADGSPARRVKDLEPRQKKRKDEEGCGYVWDTLFTPEVMLDDLPSSFRPFTFEYGRITDPWEHMCRFENTAQLHRISDGMKCCIFATTLTGAAQQWFVQLSGGSIPTFGRLCQMFLHHFANSRKHKKARLCSSALRNMRVSR